MRKHGARFRNLDRRQLKLSTCPWKIANAWQPLDVVLAQIERDGTVDSAQGRPVLRDEMTNSWHEIAPAVEGLAEFHERAAGRRGWALDVTPLRRFANRLANNVPLVERDLEAVKACRETCKRQALRLTIAEAEDILQAVRISIALEARGNGKSERHPQGVRSGD